MYNSGGLLLFRIERPRDFSNSYSSNIINITYILLRVNKKAEDWKSFSQFSYREMHKVWYLKERIARLLLARPFISLYYNKILSTVKMRPTMLLSWMLLVNNLYLQNREKVHWSRWGQLFASPIDSIKVSIVPVVRIDESLPSIWITQPTSKHKPRVK